MDRLAVPSGVMTRWDDASGTIRDLEVTTVDLGQWTLIIREPDATRAEQVARALRWSAGEDRYPKVLSTNGEATVNTDWAGVALWVQVEGQHEFILIDVGPGCELSTK